MKSQYYTQVSACLSLQDRMNKTVNEDWINANYSWETAALVEVGEMIDHLGYKWWKKQTPNIPQAFIELVDIFHFVLSRALVEVKEEKESFDLFDAISQALYAGFYDAEGLYSDVNAPIRTNDIVVFATNFASNGGGLGFYHIGYLAFMMGYTLEDLFAQYIPKNTLNIFRQANGYKEGTYIKTWGGVEDNVFLEQLIETDPVLAQDFDLLWDALATKYEEVKNAN